MEFRVLQSEKPPTNAQTNIWPCCLLYQSHNLYYLGIDTHPVGLITMGTQITSEYEPVFRTRIVPEEDSSVITTIVEALSNVSGVEPADVPRLYDYLEVDGLERIITHAMETPTAARTAVRFVVDMYIVFVRGDGHICICDRAKSRPSAPVFETTED